AYFAHTAGLRVVTASTPQEAYSTLRAAIASDDPVLFFEPKGKYYMKGEVDRTITRDLETANVVASGRDVTIATYGPTVETALRAAIAAADEGIEIEVIDLRAISPLDVDTVVDSVRRTGRLVVAHESPGEVSVSSELITSVVERAFSSLEAAPERVTGYDTPYPPSAVEHDYLPSLDRLLDAVDRTLGRRSSRSELDLEAAR
ncbi:alpha-ketoacid dehydrogenase subunit beta, partial [Agrococcus lahaulensis]